MTGNRWASLAHVIAMGAMFALLQTGYYFELQFRLTAAYPSVLTVTLSWLVGSIAGLWVGRRSDGGGRMAWLIASLAAYFAVVILLRQFPYQRGWLPLYGLLIAVSGIHAGHFFATNRSMLASSSQLFLWENNGFVLGWLAGFAGYLRLGNAFLLFAPAAAGAIATALQFTGRRAEDRLRNWLEHDGKNRLLLFLTGFNLILLNYTLIRETTLAFQNLETSALVMALAYFTGISLGYFVSERITASTMSRLLPLFLILQMMLVAAVQLIVVYVMQFSGTNAAYAVIFLLVAVGSTSLYSVFLPRLIQPDPGQTGSYYSVEIIGSLAGLLSLGVLSLAGMTTVYAVYYVSFLGIAAIARVHRAVIGILACMIVIFLFGFDRLDRTVSALFYQQFYAGRGVEKVIYTRYSPYHKIEVLHASGDRRILLLNNHWQFGPASHENYSYFVAEYPAALLRNPVTAVLGCGSMSTVGRMGDYAKSITIVDIDQAVFETSRDFFGTFNRLGELKNWTFISDDAKHFLGTTQDTFDLIVDDIPPAKTRQIALTYTREFFELVRARLNPHGVFSLPSLTSANAKRLYGKRILATLAGVFDQVYVINDGDTSYCFATGRETAWNEAIMRAAINHPHKLTATIMLPDEVRTFVADTKTITINNMADLILY